MADLRLVSNLIGDSSYGFAQVITTSDSIYTVGLNPSGGAFVPASI
jgi:hypothetical protein